MEHMQAITLANRMANEAEAEQLARIYVTIQADNDPDVWAVLEYADEVWLADPNARPLSIWMTETTSFTLTRTGA